MDLLKSFYGFIFGERRRETDSNENLRNIYINQPNDNVNNPGNRDTDSWQLIKIFRDDSDTRQEGDCFWPFSSGFFMGPLSVEQELKRVMNEIDKHFGNMSRFHNMHNFQDNDCNWGNCPPQVEPDSESLREYYLRNPDYDGNSEDRRDISLDGKVSSQDVEKLLRSAEQHPSEGILQGPPGMPGVPGIYGSPGHHGSPGIFGIGRVYKEEVSVTVRPDGTAEIVKVYRGEDGKERRTVQTIKVN
ncbi:UNVERIFIED_CONTAM: hypothetical protein PYX00_006521 [Menopon gallinae]|uniref:Uncharacterized protein n=1 Tax=Menopon gallinae TaxID=328185 RepID=A0AAW2HVG0_9NEOP